VYCEKTWQALRIRPCLWQLKVAKALLQGDKHIVLNSGAGSGKTPWPLSCDGILIIISPLGTNWLADTVYSRPELRHAVAPAEKRSPKDQKKESVFSVSEILQNQVMVETTSIQYRQAGINAISIYNTSQPSGTLVRLTLYTSKRKLSLWSIGSLSRIPKNS
jgi:hypothetical protein